MSESKYDSKPLDFTELNTVDIRERGGKVSVDHFARTYRRGSGVGALLDSLPHLLAADDLRALVASLVRAKQQNRAILWGMGGHVIKCGLAPVLIDLMDRGFVTGIAMNGSTAIHDFEIAIAGQTSEDVEAVLPDGSFGAAEQTGREMNIAYAEAARDSLGAGEALGRKLDEIADPEFRGAERVACRLEPIRAGHRPYRCRNGYAAHAPASHRSRDRRGHPPRFPSLLFPGT